MAKNEADINRVVLESTTPTNENMARRIVEDDINRMGVREWRELARDRVKQRDLVMAAKNLLKTIKGRMKKKKKKKEISFYGVKLNRSHPNRSRVGNEQQYRFDVIRIGATRGAYP